MYPDRQHSSQGLFTALDRSESACLAWHKLGLIPDSLSEDRRHIYARRDRDLDIWHDSRRSASHILTAVTPLGLIYGFVLGQGTLYIDGRIIIDNTENQTLGDHFACAGSIEEKGTVAMEAGRDYHYHVKFHYGRQVGDSTITMGYGALQMTAELEESSPEASMLAAEEAARDADGELHRWAPARQLR